MVNQGLCKNNFMGTGIYKSFDSFLLQYSCLKIKGYYGLKMEIQNKHSILFTLLHQRTVSHPKHGVKLVSFIAAFLPGCSTGTDLNTKRLSLFAL